jgi:xylulokinase
MTLTGLPIHPMYTINKLMWLRENQPDLYNRTWKFMLFGDFVIYQLTGLPVIDSSLASRTMAMNVIDKRWEPTILEAAGIDPALLSNLASSGTVVGTVTGSIAASLGLDARTAVVTGGHDQACAALGAGIVLEGFAMDGIGTVECITPAFSRPIINERMFRHNFNCAPHVVHGMYLAYAFNFTGGSLLQWYKNSFGQAATSEAERRGISVYDVLNEAAAASPTDLLVVPHFSGSGTPYMNPTSRGAIYGLTLETRPDQIYRALLEGINYEMMVNLECLNDAGVRVNTLRAVGGGAQSDLWMQIKANIFGRKVETLHVGEAGTLGAAILAGTAIGIYSSYEAAASQLIRIKDEFFPDSRQTAIYREKYEQYKTFSSKLISQ